MSEAEPHRIKVEPDSEKPVGGPASTPARVHELKRTLANTTATLDEMQLRVEALEGAYHWQMRTTGMVLVSLLFLLIATKQISKQLELTTAATRGLSAKLNAT